MEIVLNVKEYYIILHVIVLLTCTDWSIKLIHNDNNNDNSFSSFNTMVMAIIMTIVIKGLTENY